MNHLDAQTVVDYVAGMLADSRAAAAYGHVVECERCHGLVAGAMAEMAGNAQEASGASAVTVVERPASSREPDLPAKQVDEYRLERLLGRGGMGAVYLAHDTLLDRRVAIKLLLRGGPRLRERMLVEARAVSRIKHANVVGVYRVGEADGRLHIAYELIQGQSLDCVSRPAPWTRVLEVAVGATRGLVAAHRQGVLHRDIKPANLMLAYSGDVVLVDFGLAKIGRSEGDDFQAFGEESIDSVGITETGVRMGTPRYMPPEAWCGDPATAASDIYSLGVVLYELCSGRTPHQDAPAPELCRRVLETDAPPLLSVAPQVPPAFARAIDRCLRRDPNQRFLSADALLQVVEDFALHRSLEVIDAHRETASKHRRPYVGKAPFEAEDAPVFFGRRSELRTLVELLRASSFVLVAGASGVGKTSLCRGGLLPLIARGAMGGTRRWSTIDLVPGKDPLPRLSRALAAHVEMTAEEVEALMYESPAEVARRLRRGHDFCQSHILFVDPLDELVTHSEPRQAARVAELLARLAEPGATVRLLATVDTERITEVAGLPIGPAIGGAPYLLVEPRSEQALREIILGPARLAKLELDDDLVASLISAVGAGELDLAGLQATLVERWEREA